MSKKFGSWIGGLISAMALLLLASSSFAVDYYAGFSLSANTASLCAGATQQVIGTVRNLGTKADTYTITANSEWVTVAPTKFTLQPGGDGQTIYLYITPDWNARPGVYNLEIRVDGNSHVAEKISLEILSCYSVGVQPKALTASSCIGDSVTFEADVKNLGKWEDTFDVSGTLGAVMNDSRFTLTSGASKSVRLKVPVESSNASVVLSAKSTRTPASASATLTVKGVNCYSATLASSAISKDGCLRDPLEYTFTLRNTGTEQEAYDLSTTSGKLAVTKVTVDAGSSVDFKLTLDGAEVGEVKTKVAAKSPHVSLSSEVTSRIGYCRGVAVLTTPAEFTACRGATARYQVTVKNTGKASDTFTLNASRGNLSDAKLTVGAGEVRDTYLEVQTKDLDLQKYNFTVTARSMNESVVSDVVSGAFKVDNCYAFDVSTDVPSAETCPEVESAFAIAIRNTGKVDGSFKISSTKGNLSDTQVKVKAGDTKIVTLRTVYGGANIITVSSDFLTPKNVTLNLAVKSPNTCYGFTVAADKELIRSSERKGYLFTLMAENKGEYAANLNVKLIAPDWATVDPKTFTLEARKSKQLFVYMTPPFKVDDGIYTATVEITSDRGMTATQVVKLELANVSTSEKAGTTVEAKPAKEFISGAPFKEEKEKLNITTVNKSGAAGAYGYGYTTAAPSIGQRIADAIGGFWNRVGVVGVIVIIILAAILVAAAKGKLKGLKGFKIQQEKKKGRRREEKERSEEEV